MWLNLIYLIDIVIGKNIIFILQDVWKYTIAAYNSHLGEVEDMEME